MDLNKNAYEQLKLGISTYVDKKIKDAPYDVTKIGTTMSAWQGRCSVKIDGMIYPITQSQVTDLEAGEKVYVLIPQNNYSLMTITGRVNPVAKKKETNLKNYFQFVYTQGYGHTVHYSGMTLYHEGNGVVTLNGTLTTAFGASLGAITLPAGHYWISGVGEHCGTHVKLALTNSAVSTTFAQVRGGQVAELTLTESTSCHFMIYVDANVAMTVANDYVFPIITDTPIQFGDFIDGSVDTVSMTAPTAYDYKKENANLVASQRIYRMTDSNNSSKNYMIYINNYDAHMLSFNLNLYGSYHPAVARISYYNYSSSPTVLHPNNATNCVSMVKDGAGYFTIHMGKVANVANACWIGISGQAYMGISITDIAVGYRNVDATSQPRKHIAPYNHYDLFTIVPNATIPSTTQKYTI